MLLPLAALAWPAWTPAADYPSRPLRLVVSFPPGGSADFQARILGARLAEQLGQQIIIDNRPGGSGVVALETVAKSAPNGYTLLLGPMSGLTMNPSIFSKLPYDSLRDFAPISLTSRVTLALAASPSLPAAEMPFTNVRRSIVSSAEEEIGLMCIGQFWLTKIRLSRLRTGVGAAQHRR
jgi:tripartite-type tricarboxylate transporter receptor subunit TctC